MQTLIGKQENTIFRMSLDDLNFVLDLQEQLNLSPWSLKDYQSEFKQKDSVKLILIQNKERKGFIIARLIISNSEAEIYNIGIKTSEQRKGYGEQLLNHFINICLEKHIKAIWLETRKSNSAALSLYTKLGFKIISERNNFYQFPAENAYVLKLDLTTNTEPESKSKIKEKLD